MSRKISHEAAIASKLHEGMSKIAQITKRTLGPGGLTILIEREGTTPSGELLGPLLTKDGVTVADQCFDPDPEMNLVIQAVKAICRRTNRQAGDGTTTAIVLGEAILNVSQEVLKANPDLNPQMVRESVEEASKKVLDLLKIQATPVSNSEKVAQVATISANGDREIGNIIRDAFERVGAEGIITVDEGHSAQTTIEIVEGFQIRRGAEAQDRFYNNSENTKFEAENACVILFDGTLRNYTELLPALEAIGQEYIMKQHQRALPPIVVVANEFSPEVIQFLLIQKAERGLSVCAVRGPHMTTVRTSMLDDMAILLGGTRLGAGSRALSAITIEDIGICSRIVADKYTCTFYGGAGDAEAVLKRVDQLKAARQQAESPYDGAIISDRIGALSNGVAKIGVGGNTELEIKERYHRIEDALNASRAAVEFGIIPGGGITLYRIAKDLDHLASPSIGEQILGKALKAPLLQILHNIGQESAPILEQLEKEQLLNQNVTYDARNKKLVDALEAGIIDPVKVTKVALENAVSISALLLTCGGAITFARNQ